MESAWIENSSGSQPQLMIAGPRQLNGPTSASGLLIMAMASISLGKKKTLSTNATAAPVIELKTEIILKLSRSFPLATTLIISWLARIINAATVSHGRPKRIVSRTVQMLSVIDKMAMINVREDISTTATVSAVNAALPTRRKFSEILM